MIDENTERRISRYLDGEMSAAERAAFAGELTRNPAARALLEEYAANDAAVREALRTVIVAPRRTQNSSRAGRTLLQWASGLGVMAAAAAVAFFVFPYRPGADRILAPGTPIQVAGPNAGAMATDRGNRTQFVADETLSARDVARHLQPYRDTINVQHNWVTVFDPATQRWYLVQVDQRASHTRPARYDN